MRLVSLAVRNFKGLERVELAELAPDLNLVVGPNESGKSRLVHALFYALFERYKGESEDKKALRSYGSSEPPFVEVRFEARGATWTLKKQFLKGAYARLEGNGRTWTDDDAEAMLRDLWGTRAIAGKRDVDQFLGLWPLLWVRQGSSSIAPQGHMNDDARARLRDVLATHVDEVAAGPMGERIVARAEKERDRYWTATGKETGELAAARARLAEAQQALAIALAKRAEAHGEADELAAIGRAMGELDARLVAQRARVADASARLARAKEIAARLRAQESDAARRKAEAELADRALKEHAEIAERAVAIDARIDEERRALATLIAAREALAARDAESTARMEAAHAVLETAHATHARARKTAQRAELARRDRDARDRLARAKGHEARVAEIRAGLAEARVDEGQIQRVRRASEALAKAGAALAAASAGVVLRAARDLVVDGEPLAEGGARSWTCDAPSRIVIEGVGAIEVRPGGADLDARRAKEQEARHALARELERVGATSANDAEDRFARRTALVAQLAHAEPLLAEAAPAGVAALEDDVRARAAELASLGDDEGDAPPIAEADARLAEAADAASRARAEREALHHEIARGREAIAQREQAIAQIAREKQEIATRLAALPAREALAAAAADARTRWIDARALTAALEGEHAKSGEGDAQLAFEQETRALQRLDAERAEKHARALGLEALVRAHGGEDLHERAQRAEGDVEERTATLRNVEARAIAARELTQALHAARRDVQQRLVAPVVDRVRPYLDALLPGRRVRMDENWSVVGVGDGDAEHDFESLSGGAKEQVSVLVRLALAEVLGAPEPLPIVLDDAFVNADRDRLDALLRVLYRASRKQQIVVFSCHDVAFERLGESKRFTL